MKFNLEEETKAWKELLDTGEIDESTYNKEVTKRGKTSFSLKRK